MARKHSPPAISVVIPTFNRANLLDGALAALAGQTLAKEQFEVVVVDDGSDDETKTVCRRWSRELRLGYFRIANSGIAAAKNLGLFAAEAPLVLFFDDDDLAHRELLAQHLAAHASNPEEQVAILGYTTWAPVVAVTPVMKYVVDVGQFLFAYRNLQSGQELDYRYFWGGRSSCKRAFLARHEVFDPRFRTIIEDVELGWRLRRHGLRVIFHRGAASFMVRPLTFDQFSARCQRQGRALAQFAALHPEAEVQQYCRIPEPIGCEPRAARHVWPRVAAMLEDAVAEVAALEERHQVAPPFERPRIEEKLSPLYAWTMNAFKLQGMADAMANDTLGRDRLSDHLATA